MSSKLRESNTIILAIVANQALRDELHELLTGTNFRVVLAQSAAEGLAQAEELLPAALLLDIDPVLNSEETCRRIRANPLLASIPIIMFSARQNRDERAAALSAGADDFLEKPLDGLELLARLGTITRLNTYHLLLADLTRFTWMAEHAQEGYLMLNRAGIIQHANERAIELLNLPDEYFGLPFTQAVERLYLPQPETVWKNWLAEPEPCFLVQPESPTARATWVVLESIDSSFGPEFQRTVRLRDVTERLSIFQDMRRFHTVVAHKLRTPMSLMVSNLSMLKKRMDMLPPEEIKTHMRGAVDGADRLANEIRKILTYIDAPLALNIGEAATLEELPVMVRDACQALNLQNVSIFLPETIASAQLALTSFALEMIVHELLENARKFHPQHDPTIEISTGQEREGFISLRFTDNGIHLSTEQMRWAWLPYVQGEKDFTGELPGMGIGFPMVATLIWKAGGSLRLRNRPDTPGLIVEMQIPLENTLRQVERPAAPFTRP